MRGFADNLTRPGVYINLKRYVPSVMVHCKKIYIRKQQDLPVYYVLLSSFKSALWIYKNRFRTLFILLIHDPRNVIDESEKLGQIPKQCGLLAHCPRCAYFNLLYLSYVTPVLAKDSGHQLYYISVTLLGCPYFVNILL